MHLILKPWVGNRYQPHRSQMAVNQCDHCKDVMVCITTYSQTGPLLWDDQGEPPVKKENLCEWCWIRKDWDRKAELQTVSK